MVKNLTGSPAENVTLRIDEDDSFDVHKTKEGKEKSYIRLGEGKLKFDVDATIQKLVESFLQLKVNIHDLLHQDFIVLIPKNEEAFKKFIYETSTTKKDRVIISKNEERILESFGEHFHLVKLKEVDQYDFRMALVITSENEKLAWLLKKMVSTYYLGKIRWKSSQKN